MGYLISSHYHKILIQELCTFREKETAIGKSVEIALLEACLDSMFRDSALWRPVSGPQGIVYRAVAVDYLSLTREQQDNIIVVASVTNLHIVWGHGFPLAIHPLFIRLAMRWGSRKGMTNIPWLTALVPECEETIRRWPLNTGDFTASLAAMAKPERAMAISYVAQMLRELPGLQEVRSRPPFRAAGSIDTQWDLSSRTRKLWP